MRKASLRVRARRAGRPVPLRGRRLSARRSAAPHTHRSRFREASPCLPSGCSTSSADRPVEPRGPGTAHGEHGPPLPQRTWNGGDDQQPLVVISVRLPVRYSCTPGLELRRFGGGLTGVRAFSVHSDQLAPAGGAGGALTVSTGQSAPRITFWVTLPMTNWAVRPRPCVPITIRSTPFARANSVMVWEG